MKVIRTLYANTSFRTLFLSWIFSSSEGEGNEKRKRETNSWGKRKGDD